MELNAGNNLCVAIDLFPSYCSNFQYFSGFIVMTTEMFIHDVLKCRECREA